jgi:hypothetical protein
MVFGAYGDPTVANVPFAVRLYAELMTFARVLSAFFLAMVAIEDR